MENGGRAELQSIVGKANSVLVQLESACVSLGSAEVKIAELLQEVR